MPASIEADGLKGAEVRGSTGEVFRVFLKLGVTSFGGPIAHLGYFRDELVVRRFWPLPVRYRLLRDPRLDTSLRER